MLLGHRIRRVALWPGNGRAPTLTWIDAGCKRRLRRLIKKAEASHQRLGYGRPVAYSAVGTMLGVVRNIASPNPTTCAAAGRRPLSSPPAAATNGRKVRRY
jgi:hypothetical protein